MVHIKWADTSTHPVTGVLKDYLNVYVLDFIKAHPEGPPAAKMREDIEKKWIYQLRSQVPCLVFFNNSVLVLDQMITFSRNARTSFL